MEGLTLRSHGDAPITPGGKGAVPMRRDIGDIGLPGGEDPDLVARLPAVIEDTQAWRGGNEVRVDTLLGLLGQLHLLRTGREEKGEKGEGEEREFIHSRERTSAICPPIPMV